MANRHPASVYWCHQCSAEISVHGDLICPDCEGGFIEAMESACALTHVRRAVQRHEHSQRMEALLRSLDATFAEEESSRQGRDVTREASDSDATQSDVTHVTGVLDVYDMPHDTLGMLSGTPRDALGMSDEPDVYGELLLPPRSIVRRELLNELRAPGLDETGLLSDVNASSRHGDSELVGSELFDHVAVANTASGPEELGEDAEWHTGLRAEGSVYSHDNADEDDDDSDSDAEVELGDWVSFEEDEEDEWEDNELRILEGLHDDAEGDVEVVSGVGQEGNEEPSEDSPNALLPRRFRQITYNLRRNLLNYNLEMDFENLDLDTYVGNPGDYVDANSFEELLQQFIDSDNSRRGAPPAAKSAIKGLHTVVVHQEEVENGSALCPICKDAIAINEPAKQLPCLHLYHSECILPWLSARNSCPVCRYELPTDDPDYEEQRRSEKRWQVARQEATGGNSISSAASGRGGWGSEGNLNGESGEVDTMEMFLEASKGEVAEEVEARICESEDGSGNGHAHERVSMLDGIAGTVFGVVGLIVVSCVGKLLLGSSSQNRPVDGHVGRVKGGRSWWTQFFR